MKLDFSDMGLTYFESEGFWARAWDDLSAEEKAQQTIWAWDRWIISSCAERNGGHSWWLDWGEDDGLWLHCEHCPAGANEIYPDGQDLIYGELPLLNGEVLRIDCGMVSLDVPVQGYSGPVRVWVEEEKHYSWEFGGYEYDAWVIVEAA